MYSIDFACSLIELSDYQIRQVERLGLVIPQKISGMKYYNFSDLLIIKLISVLIREGIKYNKIQIALDYLREVKPEQSLSSLSLIVRGKEIIDITDHQNHAIIISKYGQLISKEILGILSLGTEMNAFRLSIQNTVLDLKKRAQKKTQEHTLEDVRALLYS